MTREQIIKEHRKLWNWIADKTLEERHLVPKVRYFAEYGIDPPVSYCWCCEYGAHRSRLFSKCVYCPIDWGRDKNNKVSCCNINSPYSKWLDEKDYLKYAEYAREIANLPERKV